MAINRFYQPPQLDMSFQVYNPVKWQPNMELWGKVFGEKQQELNTIRDLRSPEHIEESSDAVKTQMGKIRSARDKVVEAYKSGNLSEAVMMQSELVGDVRRAVQPGGWFYDEEALYKKAIKTKEDLDELLKDSPVHWKQEAYKRMTREGSTIDADGNYIVGSVGAPTWAAYQDIPEYLFDALKDYKPDGTTFKYHSRDGRLFYYGTTEQVTYEDVYKDAMALATQPRFGHQIKIEAERLGFDATTVTDDANETIKKLKDNLSTKKGISEVQQLLSEAGIYNGPVNGVINDRLNKAITDYEAKLLARDPLQLATTTLLDKYVSPVARKYSYLNIGSFNAKFDPYALKAWEKINDRPNQPMIETTAYQHDTGLPEWDDLGLKIDKSGEVSILQKTYSRDDNPYEEGTFAHNMWNFGYTFSGMDGKSIYYPSSTELSDYFDRHRDNIHPLVLNIYDSNKTYLEGLSNKEIFKFIKAKYEEKREVLSQNRGYYQAFRDVPTVEAQNKLIIGTYNGTGANASGGKYGSIESSTVWAYNSSTQTVEKMPLNKIIDKYYSRAKKNKNGVTEFIKNAKILGSLDNRNPFTFAGYYGFFIDEDGTKRTMYIDSSQGKFSAFNIERFTLSQPVFSGVENESGLISSSVLPADADGNPFKIKAIANDVYTMDLVTRSGYFDLATTRDMNPDALTEADKEVLNKWDPIYKEIQRDPLNNKYVGRESYIYDENNNPVMMNINGVSTHLSTVQYFDLLGEAFGISGNLGSGVDPVIGGYLQNN